MGLFRVGGTPDWAHGPKRRRRAPGRQLAAFPGLAIFITTLGINLFGDGLRDLLDPHRVPAAATARME